MQPHVSTLGSFAFLFFFSLSSLYSQAFIRGSGLLSLIRRMSPLTFITPSLSRVFSLIDWRFPFPCFLSFIFYYRPLIFLNHPFLLWFHSSHPTWLPPLFFLSYSPCWMSGTNNHIITSIHTPFLPNSNHHTSKLLSPPFISFSPGAHVNAIHPKTPFLDLLSMRVQLKDGVFIPLKRMWYDPSFIVHNHCQNRPVILLNLKRSTSLVFTCCFSYPPALPLFSPNISKKKAFVCTSFWDALFFYPTVYNYFTSFFSVTKWFNFVDLYLFHFHFP